MAIAGATFSAVECAAESFQDSEDSWNSMIGGMAAGVVIGSRTKRFNVMTSTVFATGLAMLAFDYTGPIGGQNI